MQQFNYKAKTKTGELQEGIIEAENESSAAAVITAKSLTPISIQKISKSPISGFLKHISLNDKVLISRQLATMVKAGLPLSQALKTLQGQITNSHLKEILDSVYSNVEGGSSLSESFKKFPELFSPLDITLIASGETSGNLDTALLRLANQLQNDQTMTRKIRGAMIYPAVILVVVIGVVAFLLSYVMPQMKELYSSLGTNLPLPTQILLAFTDIVTKYIVFIVIFLVIFIVALRHVLLNTKQGRKIWDSFKLKAPAIGQLVRMTYMARFTRTLSGLVASGVPILDSLKIVSDSIGNVFYQEAILASANKVKSGVALSETLKENELFPDIVPQMIAVGEQTGELDNMLANMSEYYEEEVDTLIKGISTLIEPILIVFLGGIVALILLAIMMPLYSLNTNSFK